MIVHLSSRQIDKTGQHYLLLVYIAINNCVWQDAITIERHPQPAALAAHSALTIDKCRWLRLTVNQV